MNFFSRLLKNFKGKETPTDDDALAAAETLSAELRAGADPIGKMPEINAAMHSTMRIHADEITTWATQTFETVRASNPGIETRDILRRMLDQRCKFRRGETDREEVLDQYGSLHGICYFLGLNSELMSGVMVGRCLQYTDYVDIALGKRGVKAIMLEEKKKYFRALELPEDEAGKNQLGGA